MDLLRYKETDFDVVEGRVLGLGHMVDRERIEGNGTGKDGILTTECQPLWEPDLTGRRTDGRPGDRMEEAQKRVYSERVTSGNTSDTNFNVGRVVGLGK